MASSAARPAELVPPPYGSRSGFAPQRREDYGDGGAFPEIHVAQHPLDMGRRDDDDGDGAQGSSSVLAPTVDGSGRLAFDDVVRRMENALKTVYSSPGQPGDVVPKIAAIAMDDDEKDDDKAVKEATARANAALQAIFHVHPSAVQPVRIRPHGRGPTFIKYKPARESAAFNSGAAGRIISLDQASVDPFQPPKHKHRRVPRLAGSPPVPVMSSPPRPLSRKDQQDWRVPPCLSNWKNPKGYSIPLDKRLASDGRGRLTDVQISAGFAGLAEALYAAEKKAREAVQLRKTVQKELMMREKERRGQELRRLADKARAERADGAPAPPVGAGKESSEQSKAKMERDVLREQRRRERRLEGRAAAAATGKETKVTRDRDRDAGERIALGMASTGGGAGGEVTYDERLFNQDGGLYSGLAADDQYNVYSGRLFPAQPTLSTLCRPNKHGDSGDADEQLEKITKTDRFKPDKGFSGAPEKVAGKRERPIEFDEPQQEDDPFDLDQFLTQVKKGEKH